MAPLVRVMKSRPAPIRAMKRKGIRADTMKWRRWDGDAMEEDHRHGILQQGEGHGGKEDEDDKAEPADQMTIDEKLPQMFGHGVRHAGHEEGQFVAHRFQQLGLWHQVREPHQQE